MINRKVLYGYQIQNGTLEEYSVLPGSAALEQA